MEDDYFMTNSKEEVDVAKLYGNECILPKENLQ